MSEGAALPLGAGVARPRQAPAQGAAQPQQVARLGTARLQRAGVLAPGEHLAPEGCLPSASRGCSHQVSSPPRGGCPPSKSSPPGAAGRRRTGFSPGASSPRGGLLTPGEHSPPGVTHLQHLGPPLSHSLLVASTMMHSSLLH